MAPAPLDQPPSSATSMRHRLAQQLFLSKRLEASRYLSGHLTGVSNEDIAKIAQECVEAVGIDKRHQDDAVASLAGGL